MKYSDPKNFKMALRSNLVSLEGDSSYVSNSYSGDAAFAVGAISGGVTSGDASIRLNDSVCLTSSLTT